MHITFNIKLAKKKFYRRRRSQRLRLTIENNNDNLLRRILNEDTNEQANTTMKMKNA
jgi:hypothetical protein